MIGKARAPGVHDIFNLEQNKVQKRIIFKEDNNTGRLKTWARCHSFCLCFSWFCVLQDLFDYGIGKFEQKRIG